MTPKSLIRLFGVTSFEYFLLKTLLAWKINIYFVAQSTFKIRLL